MTRRGWLLCAILLAACGDDDGEASQVDGGSSDPDAPGGSPGEVLRVEGRFLLDRCGHRLVIRGVEQIFGLGIDVGGSWSSLVDQIAMTGANTVRILPNLSQLDTADVDAILTQITSHDMVAFVSPGDRSWFLREDVKTMLAAHEGWIVVDAFQEPTYDDRARWKSDVLAAITEVRGAGYRVPVCVLANQYGRDLPSIFMDGAEIEAGDPLHGTILGWQSYWGSTGYYQSTYGMSLTEGIERAAEQSFPVQSGILRITDGTTEMMDYAGVMAAAEAQEIGWLWWDWYNPFDSMPNGLTNDGTMAGMTDFGMAVVSSDPASLANTSVKACRPPGS